MKSKLLILLTLAYLSVGFTASAVLIVSDGFDNTTGTGTAPTGAYVGDNTELDDSNNINKAAGIGWTSNWSTDSDGRWFARNFNSGAYSDGTNTITRVNPTGSAGSIRAQGGSGFDTLNRSFTSTGGQVYFAFTLQGAVGNDNFRLAVTDSSDNGFWLADNGVNLGVSSINGSFLDLGTTLTGTGDANVDLLVVGIDNVGAASTGVSVWFNPTSLDDIANLTATQTFTITSGGNLEKFTLFSGGSNNVQIDDFRLGTTLDDVTGVVQIPEPASYALLAWEVMTLFILRRFQPKS